MASVGLLSEFYTISFQDWYHFRCIKTIGDNILLGRISWQTSLFTWLLMYNSNIPRHCLSDISESLKLIVLKKYFFMSKCTRESAESRISQYSFQYFMSYP